MVKSVVPKPPIVVLALLISVEPAVNRSLALPNLYCVLLVVAPLLAVQVKLALVLAVPVLRALYWDGVDHPAICAVLAAPSITQTPDLLWLDMW